jgi:alpha-1,2-mannosyltransferase
MRRLPVLIPPTIAASLIFAILGLAAVGAIASRRSDHDFMIYVEAGQRILDGRPLYIDNHPGDHWEEDFVGPPFQGVFFVPFGYLARTNYAVARTLWDLANLTTLLAGLWCWARAFAPALTRCAPLWRSLAAVVALAAVSVPVFASLRNANTTSWIFLALGAAALALTRQHPVAAGTIIGAAAAFKAFPALFILYLVFRREWRGAMAAVATAATLTLMLALFVGWTEYVEAVRVWVTHSSVAPPWSQNQSVANLVRRLVPSWSASALLAGWAILVIATTVTVTRRTPRQASALDFALVSAATVLLSPVVWNHYFILLLPAAVVAFAAPGPSLRLRQAAVFACAFLLSVLSRLTLGEDGADVARIWGHSTIAGVILAFSAAAAMREQHLSKQGNA